MYMIVGRNLYIAGYFNCFNEPAMNIGVIDCPLHDEFFTAAKANGHQLQIRKLYYTGTEVKDISTRSEDILLVESVDSIINDSEIEMVILSGRHKSLATKVLEAGKAVRVIS
jgi:hypothetical protein